MPSEILGLPTGIYIIGIAIGAIVTLFWWYSGDDNILSNVIDLYDDSPLDLYVTGMFKTLPQSKREIIRDLIEVASPLTERTPSDLDNKTLKLLQDFVAENQKKTE